jgi:FAD:protein FMN transferase
MTRSTYSVTFPAMSTTVTVIGVNVAGKVFDQASGQIRADVAAWEKRFSRFRPDSMLSEVNARTGTWTPVDEPFLDVVTTAKEAVFATNGRFDPAILPMLEAEGYRRTIDVTRSSTALVEPRPTTPAGIDAWMAVEVDSSASKLRLPSGMRIDFGGIAKGVLADRLAERHAGWPGGAISIGGDMRMWGTPPSGNVWRVGIEHPLDPDQDIGSVALSGPDWTAIATSSRTKRSWRNSDGDAHHLIDPATGRPLATSLLAVTACASSAARAEIVTKNLLVASAEGSLTDSLLLHAHWAITIADDLRITRISPEAA